MVNNAVTPPNAPSVLDRLARAWVTHTKRFTDAEVNVPDTLLTAIDTDASVEALDIMADAGGHIHGLLEAAGFLGFSEDDVQRHAARLRKEDGTNGN